MAIRLGQRQVLKGGPWTGVFNTPDPWDGGPDKLRDARNMYNPDPSGGAGMYARPGFVLLNGRDAVHTSATAFKGQGGFSHFGLDGKPIDFCVFGGRLFRYDPSTDLTTNVTPVGVTIDAATDTRVYFADMGGVMCVTDGVNRPWIASNLSSTPITGTYINFDGLGTSWTAFGPPVVFGGSGFFVLDTINSVAARIDLVWSEPNDWTVGYQQTNYDNRWTLEQTGTTPIFGLAATNVALYYFRQRSIGSISGAVGPDLATTATHDAISANVGTQAPQTIVQFGGTIYFCDVAGRPWVFAIASPPRPIWHQLRGIVDTSSLAYPAVTATVATAAFEPTLNMYCVGIWSPTPSAKASVTEWHAFDAATGNYQGRWSIGASATGMSVDTLCTFTDNAGRGKLVALGSATVDGVSGFAWGMNSLIGVPDLLTTENDVILTTEDTPGIELTVEGQVGVWLDNAAVPLITVQTDRMGYDDGIVWLYDYATFLTASRAPITVTVQTPNTTGTLAGTPTPNDSDDAVYRTNCGLNLNGRGALVTVSPTTAGDQWSLNRVTLFGTPNPAAPDDQ